MRASRISRIVSKPSVARSFTTATDAALLQTHRKVAESLTDAWKGPNLVGGKSKLYIDGEWLDSSAQDWLEVRDPSTQTLLSHVPETTPSELQAAITSCAEAFPSWSSTSLLYRQGIMLKLQHLIRNHMDDLAQCIVLEQGKTFADAKGDVLRGLQVVEVACAATTTLLGSHSEVSKDMDTYVRRVPLGVTAAIAPFNFPAMIPLWSLPLATVTGNTFLLKPSERDPGAALMISELATMAGLPKGVMNVVHGSRGVVQGILDAPEIKAISFVGSDNAGKYIYETGIKNGKRVQANLGAKNHGILMPSCNKNFALNAIAGAAFGAAGQRCMALSTLVVVGEAEAWLPELVERAKALRVSSGFDEKADLGPVISPESKERIHKIIENAPSEGGKILLDGRNPSIENFPNGNFISPTIIEVNVNSEAYQKEIFGPVLVVLKVDTLEEAIQMINKNRYGNGAAIFTNSGSEARTFEVQCEAGQLGVNVPIPVPLPQFGWTGNKGSFLGDIPFYGPGGINFYTQNKSITANWRHEDAAATSKATVNMPTMS